METKFSDTNQTDPLVDDILVGVEPIYQSITNIIYTQRKQRLFLPAFGTDLIDYIFEPMTPENLFAIKNEILDAIEEWEPRVEVSRSRSDILSPDTHEIDIFITFTVIGLGEEEYVYQTRLEKNKIGQYYAK